MKENELADCQQKLDRLKQDFDQFVYQVSHDLNAPVRAILNLSAWIAEDLGTAIPAEVKQHVDLLQNRSHRLEGMLQAILALSRVGRTNLEKKIISFPNFLHDITRRYKNAKTDIAIDTEVTELIIYHQKLQTVLEELLRNAIKHAETDSVIIQIKANQDTENLLISITDNGPGIKADAEDKIFSLFYRAHGYEAREGIGAGLTLVKHNLEFVGGNISVKNNLNGKGSTFIVCWPLESGE